jgi:hypothetical protein
MGTNSLPFLLWRLEHLHPTFPEEMVMWLEAQLERHAINPPWDRIRNRATGRYEAIMIAFELLGHRAAPAIPELQRRFYSSDEEQSHFALQLLTPMYPEGTAVVIAASTNQTIPMRRYVCYALHRVAGSHPDAFAALLGMADDPDLYVRARVASILRDYEKEAAAVVPVLCRLLGDRAGHVREEARISLRDFKGDIRADEPVLSALAADPDQKIGAHASEILQKRKGAPFSLLSVPAATPAPLQ